MAHFMTENKMRPELLCPAGNPEKLMAALKYGADAVYLAGKKFGMRSAANNFTVEQIYDAVKTAKTFGAKIYVTVNTMPHTDEYIKLEEYLNDLKRSGISAIIAADIGVISLIKRILPEVEIHLSTQANAVSAATCIEYMKLGCSRVVLARELTLEEIKRIRNEVPKELELEAFVHGSMCVSMSGRCLLSNYITGRDANRGECTQPCRWEYKMYSIGEIKRPNDHFNLEETEEGSFVMSSKDMCMIEHIPELIEAGISSFKIEGRMKSSYYTAVTANAYRAVIDSYLKDPLGYKFDSVWMDELESVSHREYCTGYYYDIPSSNAFTVTKPGYVVDKAYLAEVKSYDNGRAVMIQNIYTPFTLSNQLCISLK